MSILSQEQNSVTTSVETSMFANTLNPKTSAITQFTLMRGVTDFSNLMQFDLYETGYSFLILLQLPTFLTKLSNIDAYKGLIDSYQHILEYEFRGAQGIEDITTETNSITNGIDDLSIITRVREQAASSFSMNYYERGGSVLTKTHELYLRGIKDPRTQIKRYNGLLQSRENADGSAVGNKTNVMSMSDKGYHSEIFNFLLIVTDNSGLNLERAYLLTACQPTTAHTTIYNVTKGEIGFSELSCTFNGFPISGKVVNARGVKFLDWINDNTCFDEMDFGYSALDNSKCGLDDEGNIIASITKSPTVSLNSDGAVSFNDLPSSNVGEEEE